MSRFLLLAMLLGSLSMVAGCGGHDGGLATDSGDVSIEEYEKQNAEAMGSMAPPQGATDK